MRDRSRFCWMLQMYLMPTKKHRRTKLLNPNTTFKNRLIKRLYPPQFIDNCMTKIKYTQRHRYLQASQPRSITTKPIFKYLPPPHFNRLQTIILHNYDKIQQWMDKPLLNNNVHEHIVTRVHEESEFPHFP